MIEDLKPLLGKLAIFAKDRLGFEHPPKLFLKQDKENGSCALGKTAHYDPAESAVTIFVSNRHPKDILRSFVHELVHHCQNLRGDLTPEKMKTVKQNYAQEDDHMRKMEQEAYLEGNMCFRDWEDGLDDKLQYRLTIAEQKFLKENKQMTVKIDKQFLKGLITKLLEEREVEEIASEEPKCAKGCDCEKCNAKEAAGDEEESLEEGELPAGLQAYQDKKSRTSPGDTEEAAEEAAEEAVEERIQTPEQEDSLYESRFAHRNTRLFEKLLKEWTK